MSKESYTRGFCKAAEAAGVDPNELMKFAQEFKTNGWVPKPVANVVAKRPDVIPLYIPSEDTVLDNDGSKDMTDIGVGLALNCATNRSLASGNNDPRYRNWLGAHVKALGEANSDPLKKLYQKYRLESIRRDDGKGVLGSIADLRERIYRESMLQSTGTPQRVSAPVKK